MRRLNWIVLVPLASAAIACGRNSSPAVDDALKSDLALASQSQPYNPNQVVSPAEAGFAAQQQLAPRALQTAARQPAAAPRRATSARRSGSARSSGGGYYPSSAPAAPPVVVEKHTQRDAAIGAAAGAVIGAVSARDKVKGGLIGAAAGGILGAVIGNNVDITKRVGW